MRTAEIKNTVSLANRVCPLRFVRKSVRQHCAHYHISKTRRRTRSIQPLPNCCRQKRHPGTIPVASTVLNKLDGPILTSGRRELIGKVCNPARAVVSNGKQ